MDLSIIIVSFNTKELLKRCLLSVFKTVNGVTFEVIVVDNASQDGSPEMVKESFPGVRLIENDTNAGFAKANNLAINAARGRFLFLLNSDTVLQASPRTVLDYLDSERNVGLLGCRIVYGNSALQRSAWRFPTLFQEWYYFSFDIIRTFIPALSKLRYRGIDYNVKTETDCVSGCSLFIRKTLLDLIGVLDERFFMYYEDTEYCYRARMKTQYRTVYYPHYQVVHYHGMSGNRLKATLRSFNSAQYYFFKTKGPRTASLFIATCRASWQCNLALLTVLGLVVRSRKVAEKIETFRKLLAFTQKFSSKKRMGDHAEAETFLESVCKSS